jgi:hypothetical protein
VKLAPPSVAADTKALDRRFYFIHRGVGPPLDATNASGPDAIRQGVTAVVSDTNLADLCHWATSARRAVNVRRLARNGTSRSAATTIAYAAAMVTG